MLKYTIYTIIGIILIIGLSSIFHLTKVHLKNKREMSQYMDKNEVYNNDLGRVLVIYYSLTGNTKKIANQIKEITNADIYEIKTIDELKPGFFVYSKIKKQLATIIYPKIKNDNFPDFNQYDIIFVGSPIWWYTVSTPVSSFLKEVNFNDKLVIPFSTQGSNYGSYFKDFKDQVQNARVKNGAAFNNLPEEYDAAVKNKIIFWLNSIK